MNRGAPSFSKVGPVTVGAVTLLISLVAVFLSYNANNGLPFVATYQVNAHLPNADTLVRGNEVRVGGVRVGRIDSVTPLTLDDGREVANVEMSLDPAVDPLPLDSAVIVRPRSALSLKYLEISPGDSEEGLEAGEALPVTAARVEPVDLDELFNTFDEETRLGVQGNLQGFGDALAGRGFDLNEAFGSLAPLLQVAQPVTKNLASRSTRFEEFFVALAATAAEVAPVAQEQAELFGGLDRTFAAFAAISEPYLAETIERSPAALAEANRSLPVVQPFLTHSAEFFTALQPGAEALRDTSPEITAAFESGAEVLPGVPALNRELPPTAQALVDFQNAPGTRPGLKGLIAANQALHPGIRHIAPAQTVCNYLTILFENVARTGAQGDGLGHWQNFFPITPPYGPNAESGPASSFANGGETETPPELPLPVGVDRNFLHSNPYPNTASPGQTFECEAGREPWERNRAVLGNVPGNQGTKTRGQSADGEVPR